MSAIRMQLGIHTKWLIAIVDSTCECLRGRDLTSSSLLARVCILAVVLIVARSECMPSLNQLRDISNVAQSCLFTSAQVAE